MATGDLAASAGLAVYASTDKPKLGYDALNKRGDEIANHLVNGGHDWTKVTGKPATFPPSGHTHPTSDVTGLDGALGGKADAASTTAALGGKAGQDTSAGGQYVTFRRSGSSIWFDQGGSYLNLITGADTLTADADKVTAAAYNRNAVGSNYFQMWMNDARQIMRNTSARKYKEAIEPHQIDPGDVLALEPVTYHRKADPTQSREFGLIADDVETTLPEIVTYFDGQVDGIRYDLLAVALLAVVKDQQARIEALEQTVKGGV